ncbi:immunoglobulin superfamily member 23 [Macrotis lagotis]|uniref:immunoglobulin superfamily member 23 n=1 Tax=Macrotis lagotis TaxID=92651 RepID=UPI003D69EF79
MELSRDPPQDSGSPWKRFLLTATLLSFWTHLGSTEFFIVTVPKQPIEGGNVRLTALNTPNHIINASWYSGLRPQDPDMITNRILTTQVGSYTQHLGPAHTRREVLTNWNTLEIRNLTPSDTGFYSLVLKTNSEQEKASTYIRVRRQHEFILSPDISASMTVAVENKDSVVFTCHTSESNITILWYDGGLLLQGGGRLELTNGNRTLTIRQVKRNDRGLYYCKVIDESDSRTSDSIQLTVLYGPESLMMTTYPKIYNDTIVSNLSYSVILRCSASGNPIPLISWLFNGNVCGTQDKHIIQRLTQKDLGNYMCRAQNRVGVIISNPIQVQLPKTTSEDATVEPTEPDPVYSLSGAPAICLTIAGTVGIITFFGCIVNAVINRKALREGRIKDCSCF